MIYIFNPFMNRILLILLWIFSSGISEGLLLENEIEWELEIEFSIPNFEHNPFITSEMRTAMKPWLLPFSHPARETLEALFQAKRISLDEDSFKEAGFKILKMQPRSHICLAEHPELPGYLLKVYLDNVLMEKKGKPGWYWFVKRCEGASKIRKIITKKKFKHFKVPGKWIFTLPIDPSPPDDAQYKRKTEILLVEHMDLVSSEENLEAWKTKITKEYLNELYEIIHYAHGASYRPENIPFCKDGKFAFIDTEYPHLGPDFTSIRPHLSPEMRAYWQSLIRKDLKQKKMRSNPRKNLGCFETNSRPLA